MKMTILQRDDGITHVALAGRLDTTGVEDIDESFSAATGSRERPAIIDLSEIEFMASRGIGLLIGNTKRLNKAGHKLVLLNPQELVEAAIKTCRVDLLMPIVHDLDDAIRIVQGTAGQAGAAPPPAATVEAAPEPQPSPGETSAPAVSAGELKLSIKNELSELPGLNAALAQFLDAHGVPSKTTYAVNLAIDELVVNVMRYAYVDERAHTIDIELAVAGDRVILRIVDDGRPFDPRTGPALDLHAEAREVGKLGLTLVLEMVDVLKYQRRDEKNWVEVRIRIVADGQGGDLPVTQQASPGA